MTAQLAQIDVRSVRRHIASGAWQSRETERRGRNGKPVREIWLASLPMQLQLKFAELNRAPEPVEQEAEGESASADDRLEKTLLWYDADEREAFLLEANRLFAITKTYAAINPKRVKTADGKHEFVREILALCETAKCVCPIILRSEPRRAKAPSPHTLNNWYQSAIVENNGVMTFLRSPQESNAASDKRRVEISPEAVEWINETQSRYAHPRSQYRDWQRIAKKKRWTIASESWLRRRWAEIPEIVKTVQRGGWKAYESKHAPYVQRTVLDLGALEVLCGDHHCCDVCVTMPDGSLDRPWLTIWLDLRTYLIWGWHLDRTPSTRTIGLAYANGVMTFGAQPPDSAVLTDNGKDYKARSLSGQVLTFKKAGMVDGAMEMLLTQHKVGLFDELYIEHILARPYNGKEKPAERIFKDIADWIQNYLGLAWCGRDAKDKPEAYVRAWHGHQKWQKTRRGESPFPTFEFFRNLLADRIHEHNASVHRRMVTNSATAVPLEEFSQLYNTRYTIKEETLAMLLLKKDARKIGKNGVQAFQPHYRFLHPEMAEHKGETVEIRYSDEDYTRIWAVLPATSTKPSRIVEASLITASGIRNPNRETLKTIAVQKAHERKIYREFQLLAHSQMRGESTEQRVAAMLEAADVEPIELPIAVGAEDHQSPPTQTVVQMFNRMSGAKLHAVGKQSKATAQDFAAITPDETILSEPDEPTGGNVVWLDEWDK